MINLLAALGLVLYLVFQCFGYALHIPEPDMQMKSLAFALVLLVQIVRGLIWHLEYKPVPQWLGLKKMDKRFAADTTVVFLVLFVTLELTLRNKVGPQSELLVRQVLIFFMGAQVILGAWLLLLSTRKSKVPLPILLLAMVAFLLPILAAVGVGYATYNFLHLQGERELEILGVSCFVPILIACAMILVDDKRDRVKNTRVVMTSQFMTLPAIPLCYMLLHTFWPKNISALFVLGVILILMVLPAAFIRSRRKAWRAKEKVETLTLSAPGSSKLEVQAEIKQILDDLSVKHLKLKDATDHIDRADAFWKLGDLQLEMMEFVDAETSYRAAIDSYNDALKLDGDNRIAISNKFNAVECLNQLQRRRF